MLEDKNWMPTRKAPPAAHVKQILWDSRMVEAPARLIPAIAGRSSAGVVALSEKLSASNFASLPSHTMGCGGIENGTHCFLRTQQKGDGGTG
jgi:hypothetical protein